MSDVLLHLRVAAGEALDVEGHVLQLLWCDVRKPSRKFWARANNLAVEAALEHSAAVPYVVLLAAVQQHLRVVHKPLQQMVLRRFGVIGAARVVHRIILAEGPLPRFGAERAPRAPAPRGAHALERAQRLIVAPQQARVDRVLVFEELRQAARRRGRRGARRRRRRRLGDEERLGERRRLLLRREVGRDAEVAAELLRRAFGEQRGGDSAARRREQLGRLQEVGRVHEREEGRVVSPRFGGQLVHV